LLPPLTVRCGLKSAPVVATDADGVSEAAYELLCASGGGLDGKDDELEEALFVRTGISTLPLTSALP
jgi:hypothetical protein